MCGNNCGGFGGNCSWILIIILLLRRRDPELLAIPAVWAQVRASSQSSTS